MSEPCHEEPAEIEFDATDFDFDEDPVEEILESLYRPGAYNQGEALCIQILEDIDPDWEPAKLFLVLNWAAQEVESEALELLDELEDNSLFEALRLLAFGEGNDTEAMVYEDLILCAQARGLDEQLDSFFSAPATDYPSALDWLSD